jgi:solute carrier family 10 (sodium/bile acid cotransporter), member 7
MKAIEETPISMTSNNDDEHCNDMLQVEIDYEATTPTKAAGAAAAAAGGTAPCSDDDTPSKDDVERAPAAVTGTDTEEEKTDKSIYQCIFNKLCAFYTMYDFPIHILIGIGLAQAYPPLGAVYLRPKITASWVATGIIFFLSGIGLKTNELMKVVFRRFFFNAFVEGFNFGVVSLIVFGVSRALGSAGIIPQPLADGLAMTACLPMSINAVIILTTASNGDEAASIFHATFGNVCGIFLSPVLIVMYLPSVTSNINLPKVFLDLTLKVIVPLVVGQLVHITIKPIRDFYFAHKRVFKKVQETCLVYIV